MVVRYSYEEMVLLRILELNPLLPHYWSELILLAEQLLDDEEREELHDRIFNVERMVLETERIPRQMADGTVLWVERTLGRLSLYDIEMAIESNPDFYAYFERPDGLKVTKFDIERELSRLKAWLFEKVRERSSKRRFNRLR